MIAYTRYIVPGYLVCAGLVPTSGSSTPMRLRIAPPTIDGRPHSMLDQQSLPPEEGDSQEGGGAARYQEQSKQ
jgi:hypothetical protein